MKDVFGEDVLQEDWDYLIAWVKTQDWTSRTWTPRHALLRPDGAIVEFMGQDYDASQVKWLEFGWTEDRCELCGCTLKAGHEGMTPDGRNWMCVKCYGLCITINPSSDNTLLAATSHNTSDKT